MRSDAMPKSPVQVPTEPTTEGGNSSPERASHRRKRSFISIIGIHHQARHRTVSGQGIQEVRFETSLSGYDHLGAHAEAGFLIILRGDARVQRASIDANVAEWRRRFVLTKWTRRHMAAHAQRVVIRGASPSLKHVPGDGTQQGSPRLLRANPPRRQVPQCNHRSRWVRRPLRWP